MTLFQNPITLKIIIIIDMIDIIKIIVKVRVEMEVNIIISIIEAEAEKEKIVNIEGVIENLKKRRVIKETSNISTFRKK